MENTNRVRMDEGSYLKEMHFSVYLLAVSPYGFLALTDILCVQRCLPLHRRRRQLPQYTRVLEHTPDSPSYWETTNSISQNQRAEERNIPFPSKTYPS